MLQHLNDTLAHCFRNGDTVFFCAKVDQKFSFSISSLQYVAYNVYLFIYFEKVMKEAAAALLLQILLLLN